MQSGLRETNAVREKFSGEMSRLEERKIAVQSDYDGVIRQLLEQYELSLSEAQLLLQRVPVHGPAFYRRIRRRILS